MRVLFATFLLLCVEVSSPLSVLGQTPDWALFAITYEGKVYEVNPSTLDTTLVRTLPQNSPAPYHFDGLVFLNGSFYTSRVEFNNNQNVRVIRFGLSVADHQELQYTAPQDPQYNHILSLAVRPSDSKMFAAGLITSGPPFGYSEIDPSTGLASGYSTDMDGNNPRFWGMTFLSNGNLAAVRGTYASGSELDYLLPGSFFELECRMHNSSTGAGLATSDYLSGIARHPATNVLYGVSGYYFGLSEPSPGRNRITSASSLFVITDPEAQSFCSGTYENAPMPVASDETPALIGALGLDGVTDITFVDKNELPCIVDNVVLPHDDGYWLLNRRPSYCD